MAATGIHTPYPRFWKTVGGGPARRRPGVVDDYTWPEGERPLRLVVVGKGGSGKSVIAGTMARLLARRGRKVLALDTDSVPGMALSLGVKPRALPPLMDAVDKAPNGCWKLKRGIGAVRAIERFTVEAPDGVRVLEVGDKSDGEGPSLTPAAHAFYQVVHAIPEAHGLKDWTMVGDHPAGPKQTAHDWAPYADMMLVVTEPSWKSALTARRLVEIAEERGNAVLPVASKVTRPDDADLVQEVLGRAVVASVPADEAVAATDRRGVALIDDAPDSPAVRAIEELVDGLVRGTIRGTVNR
jgi:CO dehydrogenase maturation factor